MTNNEIAREAADKYHARRYRLGRQAIPELQPIIEAAIGKGVSEVRAGIYRAAADLCRAACRDRKDTVWVATQLEIFAEAEGDNDGT